MTTRTDISPERPVAVLGAGPAGLTAGYALAQRGVPVVVLEADDEVGGIAKTVVRDGYRFDLGGHRFFTKATEVQALWDEVMGDEFLLRPRMSRIHWNGRFLDYPLRAADVVRKLGAVELTRSALSYARAKARRRGDEENFEDWVTNRFGRRLYELFFRSYTEKVWGVPTTEIRAEWAAQRIRGLSFTTAARVAVFGDRDESIRSLVGEFRYPRLGPGQMWERMAAEVERMGGTVRVNAPVTRLELGDDGGVATIEAGGVEYEPAEVISSLPLRATVAMTDPAAPGAVASAAQGLRYRDFVTVALALEGPDPFPDNWIYIHDPGVRVGRIQNFRSWSPWMVPDDSKTCLGLEYFCFAGDDLWTMSDERLVDLATRELAQLGLGSAAAVERGWAVRVPRAYPMYDSEYAPRVAAIRSWLDRIPNLQQVGRNGLHRYNNSDHSMLTALRAVENVLEGTAHDLWAVNADGAYHEEHGADEHPYRAAPETPAMREPVADVEMAG